MITVHQDGKRVLSRVFSEGPITLGRLPSCDLVLDYPHFSRTHCQILEDGGTFYVIDLGSRHGFTVGGERVAQAAINDVLKIEIESVRIDLQLVQSSRPSLGTQENIATRVQSPPRPGSRAPREEGARLRIAENPAPVADAAPADPRREAHSGGRRVATASLYWQGQLMDVREFAPFKEIRLGTSEGCDLHVPTLPAGWALGQFNFEGASLLIPQGAAFVIIEPDGQVRTSEDLVRAQVARPRESAFAVRLVAQQTLRMALGSNLELVLRMAPEPERLEVRPPLAWDSEEKRSAAVSLLFHVILLLALLLMHSGAPIEIHSPRLRIARLIHEPTVATPPAPEARPEPVLSPTPDFPEIAPSPTPHPPAPPAPSLKSKSKAPPSRSMAPKKKAPSRSGIKPQGPAPSPVKKNPQVRTAPAPRSRSAVHVRPRPPAPMPKMTKESMPVRMDSKSGSPASGPGSDVRIKLYRKGQKRDPSSVLTPPWVRLRPGPQGLGPDLIRVEALKASARFERCHDQSLASGVVPRGRMEFDWEIRPDGRIASVLLMKSTVARGDSLAVCLKRSLESLRFPKAPGGRPTTSTIGFDF